MTSQLPEAIPLWPEGHPRAATLDNLPPPKLFPFPIMQGEPRGAVVICPGGGYGHLADHEGAPIAQFLNQHGLGAFVLHYRRSPHRHPVPLGDLQRAIRIVRQRAGEWNLQADRVGVLGFSAGGHLTATGGTQYNAGDPNAEDPIERQSCRPDALVLCYPVISLHRHHHGGSAANLLGADASLDDRRAQSADENVTADTPPSFLWHTADDQAVPVENSLMFAQALRNHNVPFSLHVFPHGRHGLGLAEDDPVVGAWPGLCASWLKSLGF